MLGGEEAKYHCIRLEARVNATKRQEAYTTNNESLPY